MSFQSQMGQTFDFVGIVNLLARKIDCLSQSCGATFLAIGLLTMGSLIGTPGSNVLGQDSKSSPNSVAEELLVQRWAKSSENRDYQFDYEVKPNRTSALIGLAWTINRIHHYEYDSAKRTANSIVLQFPQLLDAWYAKAWLEIRAGNIDAGLMSLQSYRENLDKAKLEREQRATHLRRMARLSGFVDGPANSKATPETLQQTLDRLIRDLDANDQQVFTQQYHETLDKFTALVDTKEDKTEQAMDEAKVRQKQELANLKQEAMDLTNEEAALEASASKIRLDVEQRLSELSRNAGPLSETAFRLESVLVSIRNDLGFLQNDYWIQLELARSEPDPHLRRLYESRAASLSFAISRQQLQLNNARREYRGVLNQLRALDAEMARVRANGNRQLNGVMASLKRVNKNMRRNSGQANRIAKSPRPKLSQVTVLKNRVRFVGTFDPFPTESLKAELLNKLN